MRSEGWRGDVEGEGGWKGGWSKEGCKKIGERGREVGRGREARGGDVEGRGEMWKEK